MVCPRRLNLILLVGSKTVIAPIELENDRETRKEKTD